MDFVYCWIFSTLLERQCNSRFLFWDYNNFVESVLRDGPTNELWAFGLVARCFFGVGVPGEMVGTTWIESICAHQAGA